MGRLLRWSVVMLLGLVIAAVGARLLGSGPFGVLRRLLLAGAMAGGGLLALRAALAG